MWRASLLETLCVLATAWAVGRVTIPSSVFLANTKRPWDSEKMFVLFIDVLGFWSVRILKFLEVDAVDRFPGGHMLRGATHRLHPVTIPADAWDEPCKGSCFDDVATLNADKGFVG